MRAVVQRAAKLRLLGAEVAIADLTRWNRWCLPWRVGPGTYFGVSAACLKVNLVIAAVASAQESSSRAAPGPWRQLRLAWIRHAARIDRDSIGQPDGGKEIHGYAERNERRAKPAGLTAKIAASADRLRQNRASHLRPADLGSSLSTARGSRNGMQFHRREQPPLGSSRQAHDRREPRAAPSRSQERLARATCQSAFSNDGRCGEAPS